MTQAELADAADCHEKTIQNLLSGRSVRDQTLFDVCMVLGLDFDKVKAAWEGEPRRAARRARGATARTGARRRSTWAPIRGPASTTTSAAISPCVRRSRSPGGIMAYRTDIIWDDDWPSLLFQERDRPDKPFLHRGRLYIPASSMYIHLVSLTKGAMRMVMVSQLDPAGQMRGLITTLSKQRALLVPVSAPIVYIKRDDFDGRCWARSGPTHRVPAHTSNCWMRRSSRATHGSSASWALSVSATSDYICVSRPIGRSLRKTYSFRSALNLTQKTQRPLGGGFPCEGYRLPARPV